MSLNKNDKYVVGVLKSGCNFTNCKDCGFFHPDDICISDDSLIFKIFEPDTATFEDFFDAVGYAAKTSVEFQNSPIVLKREDFKLKLIVSMGNK